MPLLGVSLTTMGGERLAARPPQLAIGDVVGGRELEPGRPLRLLDERVETKATIKRLQKCARKALHLDAQEAGETS